MEELEVCFRYKGDSYLREQVSERDQENEEQV